MCNIFIVTNDLFYFHGFEEIFNSLPIKKKYRFTQIDLNQACQRIEAMTSANDFFVAAPDTSNLMNGIRAIHSFNLIKQHYSRTPESLSLALLNIELGVHSCLLETDLTSIKFSRTEIALLHAISKGYDIRQSAEYLHFSERQASVHKYNIKNKLGFNNSELVRFAGLYRNWPSLVYGSPERTEGVSDALEVI